MAVPVLVAKLKLLADKSHIAKTLDSLSANIGGPEGMGDGFIKLTDMASDFIGKLMTPIRTFMGLSAKVIGFLGIVGAVMNLAQPAFRMLDNFTKLLAELVRPITDIMLMLVQPLLIMIRPVVQQFRLLMLPFRELVAQGNAAAQRLIGEGVRTGGEEGRAMIGAGFRGVISSAGLMFSGMLEVLFQPLANMLRVGDGFAKMMESVQSIAIGGVFKVMEKAEWLFNNLDDFTSITVDEMRKGFRLIDATVDETRRLIGGFSIGVWKNNLNTVQTNINTMFDPLNNFLNNRLTNVVDVNTYFNEMTTVLNNLNNILPGVTSRFADLALTIGEETANEQLFSPFIDEFSDLVDAANIERNRLNPFKEAIKTTFGFLQDPISGFKNLATSYHESLKSLLQSTNTFKDSLQTTSSEISKITEQITLDAIRARQNANNSTIISNRSASNRTFFRGGT